MLPCVAVDGAGNVDRVDDDVGVGLVCAVVEVLSVVVFVVALLMLPLL